MKVSISFLLIVLSLIGCQPSGDSTSGAPSKTEKFVGDIFSSSGTNGKSPQGSYDKQRRDMEAQRQAERLKSYDNQNYFKND